MTAHYFVYAFLFVAMGAMLYVVGTPWFTPKPRNAAREKLILLNTPRRLKTSSS